MPFYRRSISPVFLSNGHLKELKDDEREAVINSTLSRVLRQLASLLLHAEDIFHDLQEEFSMVSDRASVLQARVNTVQEKAKKLDAKAVIVPESDLTTFSERSHHHSTDYGESKQLFAPETRPAFISRMYDNAVVNPVVVLRQLDFFRSDGVRSSKFFTCTPTYRTQLDRLPLDIETRKPEALEHLPGWTGDDEDLTSPVHPDLRFHRLGHTLSEGALYQLPDPDRVTETRTERFGIEVVPVDVTGKGFQRLIKFRQSLVNFDYVKRRRKRRDRNRRNTIGDTSDIQRAVRGDQPSTSGAGRAGDSTTEASDQQTQTETSRLDSSTGDEDQEASFSTHTVRADIELAVMAAAADASASIGRLPKLGAANTFDPPAREPVYELIRRARLPLGGAAAALRQRGVTSEASSSGHGSASNRTSADSERVVSPADSGTVTSPLEENVVSSPRRRHTSPVDSGLSDGDRRLEEASLASDDTITPDLPDDGDNSSAFSCDTEGYYTSFHCDSGLRSGSGHESEYDLVGRGSTGTGTASNTSGSDSTVVLRKKPPPPPRCSSLEAGNRESIVTVIHVDEPTGADTSAPDTEAAAADASEQTATQNQQNNEPAAPSEERSEDSAIGEDRSRSEEREHSLSPSRSETRSESDLDLPERQTDFRRITAMTSGRIPSLCVITPPPSSDGDETDWMPPSPVRFMQIVSGRGPAGATVHVQPPPPPPPLAPPPDNEDTVGDTEASASSRARSLSPQRSQTAPRPAPRPPPPGTGSLDRVAARYGNMAVDIYRRVRASDAEASPNVSVGVLEDLSSSSSWSASASEQGSPERPEGRGSLGTTRTSRSRSRVMDDSSPLPTPPPDPRRSHAKAEGTDVGTARQRQDKMLHKEHREGELDRPAGQGRQSVPILEPHGVRDQAPASPVKQTVSYVTTEAERVRSPYQPVPRREVSPVDNRTTDRGYDPEHQQTVRTSPMPSDLSAYAQQHMFTHESPTATRPAHERAALSQSVMPPTSVRPQYPLTYQHPPYKPRPVAHQSRFSHPHQAQSRIPAPAMSPPAAYQHYQSPRQLRGTRPTSPPVYQHPPQPRPSPGSASPVALFGYPEQPQYRNAAGQAGASPPQNVSPPQLSDQWRSGIPRYQPARPRPPLVHSPDDSASSDSPMSIDDSPPSPGNESLNTPTSPASTATSGASPSTQTYSMLPASNASGFVRVRKATPAAGAIATPPPVAHSSPTTAATRGRKPVGDTADAKPAKSKPKSRSPFSFGRASLRSKSPAVTKHTKSRSKSPVLPTNQSESPARRDNQSESPARRANQSESPARRASQSVSEAEEEEPRTDEQKLKDRRLKKKWFWTLPLKRRDKKKNKALGGDDSDDDGGFRPGGGTGETSASFVRYESPDSVSSGVSSRASTPLTDTSLSSSYYEMEQYFPTLSTSQGSAAGVSGVSSFTGDSGSQHRRDSLPSAAPRPPDFSTGFLEYSPPDKVVSSRLSGQGDVRPPGAPSSLPTSATYATPQQRPNMVPKPPRADAGHGWPKTIPVSPQYAVVAARAAPADQQIYGNPTVFARPRPLVTTVVAPAPPSVVRTGAQAARTRRSWSGAPGGTPGTETAAGVPPTQPGQRASWAGQPATPASPGPGGSPLTPLTKPTSLSEFKELIARQGRGTADPGPASRLSAADRLRSPLSPPVQPSPPQSPLDARNSARAVLFQNRFGSRRCRTPRTNVIATTILETEEERCDDAPGRRELFRETEGDSFREEMERDSSTTTTGGSSGSSPEDALLRMSPSSPPPPYSDHDPSARANERQFTPVAARESAAPFRRSNSLPAPGRPGVQRPLPRATSSGGSGKYQYGSLPRGPLASTINYSRPRLERALRPVARAASLSGVPGGSSPTEAASAEPQRPASVACVETAL